MNRHKTKNWLYTLIFLNSLLHGSDAQLINYITRYIPLPEAVSQALEAQENNTKAMRPFTMEKEAYDWPLYRAYPKLSTNVPRVVLCTTPTPVAPLKKCGKKLGITLYLKDDGQTRSAGHFGGNKPRKLEPILADAKRHGVKTIFTFGSTGSGHAVATADCAQQLGFDCTLMLKPQPCSSIVRRNLLLMDHFGATIRFCPTQELRDAEVAHLFLRHKLDHGTYPYVIPTGAENALGAVGYVNAAFELKEQIDAGIAPEPDYIYIATGGFGHSQGLLGASIAGLIVGLKAAGLKTKAIGIYTAPQKQEVVEERLLQQCAETIALLHDADATFPAFTINKHDFRIICDCAGKKYGLYTQEGVNAMKLLKKTEGIQLDGTYTGKAFAGLMRDAKAGKLKNKKVLFWNTFCCNDFSEIVDRVSYKKLPHAVHEYFEKPTQSLDTQNKSVGRGARRII